jgi:hypothetical protein
MNHQDSFLQCRNNIAVSLRYALYNTSCNSVATMGKHKVRTVTLRADIHAVETKVTVAVSYVQRMFSATRTPLVPSSGALDGSIMSMNVVPLRI